MVLRIPYTRTYAHICSHMLHTWFGWHLAIYDQRRTCVTLLAQSRSLLKLVLKIKVLIRAPDFIWTTSNQSSHSLIHPKWNHNHLSLNGPLLGTATSKTIRQSMVYRRIRVLHIFLHPRLHRLMMAITTNNSTKHKSRRHNTNVISRSPLGIRSSIRPRKS